MAVDKQTYQDLLNLKVKLEAGKEKLESANDMADHLNPNGSLSRRSLRRIFNNIDECIETLDRTVELVKTAGEIPS